MSLPPPGDLPDPGIETASLASSSLAGRLFTSSSTWEAHMHDMNIHSTMYQRDDQKGLIEEHGNTLTYVEQEPKERRDKRVSITESSSCTSEQTQFQKSTLLR